MEDACVEYLSQAITVDNALMLLGQANFFDELELAQKCLEVSFIQFKLFEAVISVDFCFNEIELTVTVPMSPIWSKIVSFGSKYLFDLSSFAN